MFVLVVLWALASLYVGTDCNHSPCCVVDAQILNDEHIRNKPWGDVSSRSEYQALEEDGGTSKDTLLAPFLFRTDKPGHVIEGTSDAVSNIVKGTVGGAVSLLGFPVVGVRYGGLRGLVLGAIVGTIAGVSLPVVGMVLAVSQIVRGIQCTPSAVQNALNKRGQSCSTEYLLDVEARELTEKIKHGDYAKHQKNRDAQVKDTLFYDLLHVDPNATPSEIKRGYYKTAKQHHPDKSNDSDADERFRQVHIAYQTLSHVHKRELYDRNGPHMTADGHLDMDEKSLSAAIDPLVFFGIMFGSELVEPYVGELRMASEVESIFQFASVLDDGELSFDAHGYEFSWESASTRQRKRQVDIAVHLRDRISSYVLGIMTEPEFIETCRQEAEDIAKSTFGSIFLKSIGSSMKLEADEYLAYHTAIIGWMKGGINGLKKKAHAKRRDLTVYLTVLRASTSIVRTVLSSATMVGPNLEGNDEAYDRTLFRPPGDSTLRGDETSSNTKRMPSAEFDKDRLEQDLLRSLSTFLEMAWAFNVRDVTITIRDACHKLLADEEVSLSERLRRAEGLRLLGREFYRVGKDVGGSEMIPRSVMEDIQARTEVAFTSAALKAQGHDIPKRTEEQIVRLRQQQEVEEKQKPRRQSRESSTAFQRRNEQSKARVSS